MAFFRLKLHLNVNKLYYKVSICEKCRR